MICFRFTFRSLKIAPRDLVGILLGHRDETMTAGPPGDPGQGLGIATGNDPEGQEVEAGNGGLPGDHRGGPDPGHGTEIAGKGSPKEKRGKREKRRGCR